jgi:hypothetical protein
LKSAWSRKDSDESDRLRYLRSRKSGVELSTIAVDGMKLPPHGKLKRKRDL